MLRTLSTLESFYIDHDITIVTVSDLKGKINPLILQEAINAVVNMHPLLCSEVQQSPEGYFFAKRETVEDQCTILGEISKDKRKEIVLAELNNPLPKNNLIRFTLLLEERIGIIQPQHISLLMTTQHAVSDGISCIALQEQLWKMYADLANNESPAVTTFPLMPSIESLIPKNFTDNELTDYIDSYTQAEKRYQPFTMKAADKGDAPIEIHYVSKKFTRKQTKSILDHCKENNVSAHGAICAANLLALRDLFATEGQIDLSCHSPINVRSRLEPAIPNNAMFSAAIGCVHHEKVTSDTSVWTLGTDISTSIKNHVTSGDIFKSIMTYDKTRLKSPMAISMGITNVGAVNLSQKFRKLKLVSINFIPRIPLPMLAACVITSGDKLTITYPFAKPYYSTNVIKKIADLTSHYLLTL